MKIGSFVLVNEEKVNRAINGSITRLGQLTGGVGRFAPKDPEKPTKEEQEAYDARLLAEYDKLGGLITKDGLKVKIGSFWSVQDKAPRKEPQVTFVTSIEGDIVEVTEDEAKAIDLAKKKTAKLKASKSKKSKK